MNSLTATTPTLPPIGGTASPAVAASINNGSASAAVTPKKTSGDGLEFSDLLDIINPLQHIPIIDTLYRQITGDTIKPTARIAGDALYGGLIGLASGVVDTVVETATGEDIGQHIYATLFGGDDDAKQPDAAVKTADEASPSSSGPSTAAAAQQPTDPSGFFQNMQRGGKSSHFVPFSPTVPVLEIHPTLKNSIPSQTSSAAPASASSLQPTAAQPDPASTPVSSATPPSTPPTPTAGATPAVNPALVGASTPQAIPQMMMQALDKYKALSQQQNLETAGSTPPVNLLN